MTEQTIPAPVPDEPLTPEQPSVWDMIRAEMDQRDRKGRATYGRPLTAHNGRDPLQDALEEALDLAAYLKQAQIELADIRTRLAAIEATCARLEDALSHAWNVLADANSLGEVRYKGDKLLSPWPEIAEAEKATRAALAAWRQARGGADGGKGT